jgi:hypothetical protein
MTEEMHKEENCFGDDVTGTDLTNPETVLDSSIGGNVAVGDAFSHNIQL